MNAKIIFSFFALVLCSQFATAQNIVNNYSFENGGAPGENQLNNATSWSTNNFGSTDYKTTGTCGGITLCAMDNTSTMCNQLPNYHGYGCGVPYHGSRAIGIYMAAGISGSAYEAAHGTLNVGGAGMTPGTYDVSVTARNSSNPAISASAHMPSNVGVVLSVNALTNQNFNTWNAATWSGYDRAWSTTPTPNEWTTYTWTINVVNPNRYVTVTGINPKSTWAYNGGDGSNWVGGYLWVDAIIVQPAVVLPVTDLLFTATKEEEYVDLDWSTTTEIQSDYFIVQRSDDGMTFNDIATVAAAGTTNEAQYYNHIDREEIKGTVYYRLKQVDLDGKHAYSGVQVVTEEYKGVEIMSLYPNPVEEALNLIVSSSENQIYETAISSLTGSQVLAEEGSLTNGLNTISVNTHDLAAGVYVIQIKTETETLSKRFIKR